MDIYLDTAQISEIETARDLGVLRGVTTNPSHMYKAGHRDFRKAIETICALADVPRSEEHTSELQSRLHLVCRLLLEKKKKKTERQTRLQIVYSLLLEKEKNQCE